MLIKWTRYLITHLTFFHVHYYFWLGLDDGIGGMGWIKRPPPLFQ